MSAKEQIIAVLNDAIKMAEISTDSDEDAGMFIFGILRYLTEHLNDLAVILEYPGQKERIKYRQKEELQIAYRWAVVVNQRAK